MTSEWTSLEHALRYLGRVDSIPHRTEGEGVLAGLVSPEARSILDLGTGAGRLISLLLLRAPNAKGVALDFSPPMLERVRALFADDARVKVVPHDMAEPLPALGRFEVVASSFAIHHLTHERKRKLYAEVVEALEPGGLFANLEHVSSPTPALHAQFLVDMGIKPEDEDPSNKLLDVATQLRWFRELGLEDVDCLWKWRELALLVGRKRG